MSNVMLVVLLRGSGVKILRSLTLYFPGAAVLFFLLPRFEEGNGRGRAEPHGSADPQAWKPLSGHFSDESQ